MRTLTQTVLLFKVVGRAATSGNMPGKNHRKREE